MTAEVGRADADMGKAWFSPSGRKVKGVMGSFFQMSMVMFYACMRIKGGAPCNRIST